MTVRCKNPKCNLPILDSPNSFYIMGEIIYCNYCKTAHILCLYGE